MTDLSGIARHLRLSVEQIRVAAELLEQGYQPTFLERYRSDEIGGLSNHTLWSLKLGLQRLHRLQQAREKAVKQLPHDAFLDDEAQKYLQSASSVVEIEACLRAFRARRTLSLTQERDAAPEGEILPGQILERLIGFEGSAPECLATWLAEQFQVDVPTADQLLAATTRLMTSLLQGDTGLSERLRRSIQRKASLRIEMSDLQATGEVDGAHEEEGHDDDSELEAGNDEHLDEHDDEIHAESVNSEQVSDTTSEHSHDSSPLGEQVSGFDSGNQVSDSESIHAGPDSTATESAPSESAPSESAAAASAVAALENVQETIADALKDDLLASDQVSPTPEDVQLSFTDRAARKSKKEQKTSINRKSAAKPTPRQRRRRWLVATLHPMKGMKRQLNKLTAYQFLMIGRGRRSQLIDAHLDFERGPLVALARDTFVREKHPLAAWFNTTCDEIFESALRPKIQQDALADLEEIAEERLLQTAVDQLRIRLGQRPVRGHTILVVDTVGPKTAAIAVIGPEGTVLATEEIPCSALPDIVSQNVVRLGELVHKFRATLIALTNGPARRFMILSVRELMQQSANSGLRWTMADRSGAEAYAAGRIALRELPELNRRERAAVWIARSLQNPLVELLKVDISRLRLGSYQRELPQEPLRDLVRATLSDCVAQLGVDVFRASPAALQHVPGIHAETAKQVFELIGSGKIHNRPDLLTNVSQWNELDARQAIASLRVFESDNSLDGTLVHPDDYRLAVRLIENTPLALPPAAPDGWSKPSAQATPPESAEPTTSQIHDSTITSESSDQSVGENAEGSTESSELAAEIDSPELDNSGADVGAQVSDPAAEMVEGAPKGDNPTTVDQSEGCTGESESSQPVADVNSRSTMKPEYPEEIVSNSLQLPEIDVEKLARSWQVGRHRLRWIAQCLNQPFADTRLSNTPVPLLSELPSLTNLKPGTCLWAVVVGVADFGAFVELAPDCSGLIHISRLSASYIEDPHQCVQVGDLVLVWVVSVDEKKNRVALTAISPQQREQQVAEDRQSAPTREHEPRTGRGPHSRGTDRGSAPQGNATRSSTPRSSGHSTSTSGDRGRRDNRRAGGKSAGGGGHRQRTERTKTVVVNSKTPKTPISQAMKQGAEPLRSFSDLMQFYEAQRTDPPTSEVPQNDSAAQSTDGSLDQPNEN